MVGAIGGGIAGGAVGAYMDSQKRDLEKNLAKEIQAGQARIEKLPNDVVRITMTNQTAFETDSRAPSSPASTAPWTRSPTWWCATARPRSPSSGIPTTSARNDYNQKLSERRALSVAQYLESRRVDGMRLALAGKGETQPVAEQRLRERPAGEPPRRDLRRAGGAGMMRMAEKKPQGLASGLTNYGDAGFSLYLRRSFAKSMGYSGEMLARPVVGIADSRSGFNNCHRHFPELIEAVKRGVLAAGGLPIEFPTVSLGEVFLSPTSMMFRNLMSIDVEEMVRAQPMDAVVLVGGCDKTVPAQLMGAASADVPAVQLLAGPDDADLLPRRAPRRLHRLPPLLGACTAPARWTREDIEAIEGNLATTAGTCAVMGTASTMASIAEALGMALPGSAAIPAVHADRLRAAEASGRRAVELVRKPDPAVADHHARNRSRTPCACCSRSAARPTPSCTSRRSPGASA